ncbi:hypothetical protein B7L70_03485 [Vulcanisaeta sp. EB80]|uniref:hypothetical protein n=1 Tax=Vulcanisaeta sp. EB80 TaxID=1650660 RepID=UPI0009C18ED4|nr:hypothetical protein [Vulcanisaeta sp. EB80]PLC68439.1 hypothetical protein B7L70_03485 [Vulcanisaeta sp. EB80]
MVSEILQSLLPYLGFGVFAIPVLVYGAVKYAHGPTPEVRREGLDLMLDVLVGSVMFGVLSALIASNFFVNVVHVIASSVSVDVNGTATTLAARMPNTNNATQLLGWSARTAYRYFNATAGWFSAFWKVDITFAVIPPLSPFSWYLQQSTWYLQMMLTATITNLGIIYALSLIAEYAWGFAGLAVGMLLIRQTRPIGTFIITLALTALFLVPLLTAYTVIALNPALARLGVPPDLKNPTWSEVWGFLELMWNNGFQAGLMLQTYDVIVDAVLAFALVTSIGIARVFGEAITEILPI